MSERQWINGESAPRVLSRTEQIGLIPRVAEGIVHGSPNANNPLGLYELISLESVAAGMRLMPLSYDEPYALCDPNFIDRNAYLLDDTNPDVLEPDATAAAAGLIFAGIFHFGISSGMNEVELRYLLKNDMIRFGSLITAHLQRDIARIALESGMASDMAGLLEVIDASYDGTAEFLTHFDNDSAVQIEIALGIASPAVNTCDLVKATYVVQSNPDRVEIKVIEGPAPSVDSRCGGLYMKMPDGTPFHRALWDRTTRVCAALEWLFPEEIEKATSSQINRGVVY